MTLGLADSRKTPGVYLAVILGGAGTSSGSAPKKILLQGNRITAPIVGAAPTLSVAAGTMASATPTLCTSADDAGTYAGRGSELHNMAQAVFAQYPGASVWLEAVDESAGARASVVLTFAVVPLSAFTVRVYAAGKSLDVPVATGDALATIATNVCAAINNADTLPFTAQFLLGAVTLTAKNVGPRGNTLTAAFSFIAPSGTETIIGTVPTASSGSTTGTLSGGLQTGGEYLFTGGTTQDSWSAALTAIASSKYDRIVAACIDATNVDLLAAHLDSLAAVTSQRRQQGIVGSVAAISTATAFAAARNRSRLQIVWHYNTRIPIWTVAAQVAAARLIGDSFAGGRLTGEATDPAANLDGLELIGVTAQSTVANQPLSTDIETALNNGLTPLVPSVNRPGYTTVARCITSRSLSNGVPNYAVLDTSNVTILDYVADSLNATLATTYAGFKLAVDSPDGLPPRAPSVTTPALIRGVLARELAVYEERGLITNTAANLSLLTVTASPTVPGRVDCAIPCVPIPGLHVLGGDVRQLS